MAVFVAWSAVARPGLGVSVPAIRRSVRRFAVSSCGEA